MERYIPGQRWRLQITRRCPGQGQAHASDVVVRRQVIDPCRDLYSCLPLLPQHNARAKWERIARGGVGTCICRQVFAGATSEMPKRLASVLIGSDQARSWSSWRVTRCCIESLLCGGRHRVTCFADQGKVQTAPRSVGVEVVVGRAQGDGGIYL